MLPQHLTYQQGGTISIDVTSVPTTATVRILDGDGTERTGTVSATPSTIDTTLTGAISAGDTSLNVAANTGIEQGVKIHITDDPEELLVEKVAGLAVTLRRPCLYDHINAAPFEGSRVTFSVNSSVADTLWWDGYAEWNIDGTIDFTSVECTRYPMTRHASAQDLFDLEPKLYDILDGEQDVDRLLDVAHEHVLGELTKMAPDQRGRVMPASASFRMATGLAALYIHYRRRAGEDARDLADRFKTDLKREMDSITASNPRDANQDTDPTDSERISANTVRLCRG